MDEVKFIREYMDLASCDEKTARSFYMYFDLLSEMPQPTIVVTPDLPPPKAAPNLQK